MSKLVAAVIATGGASAASVGGVYILKKSSGETSDSKISSKPNASETEGADTVQKTTKTDLIFDSLDAFKNGGKSDKSKCVKDFFPGGIGDDDKLNSATELKAGSGVPVTGTFFKSVQDDSSDPYKSCLIIDWKREEYTQSGGNNKGKGKFTGTGSFVKGDEGFVNFNVAETSSADSGQLIFKGVFYLLGKGSGDSAKWEIKYKKEVSDSTKKTGITDLNKYLPDVGTGVTTDKGSYGGFFKSTQNGDRLKNICGDSDCITTDAQPALVDGVEFSWQGSKTNEAESKKLKDWSKDLTGGDNIYSKGDFDLEVKIKDFSGTGRTISSLVIQK